LAGLQIAGFLIKNKNTLKSCAYNLKTQLSKTYVALQQSLLASLAKTHRLPLSSG
jgi:hypothetical protein